MRKAMGVNIKICVVDPRVEVTLPQGEGLWSRAREKHADLHHLLSRTHKRDKAPVQRRPHSQFCRGGGSASIHAPAHTSKTPPRCRHFLPELTH
jgi:hypothetical protein